MALTPPGGAPKRGKQKPPMQPPKARRLRGTTKTNRLRDQGHTR